ncbi:uncharacterized protein LOC131158625 [Malania oleifera]|uniref:uncharacterized protein LOC131158625 n=1 Tax=Malania oleifera TaxID=397392 RepID=UPI0025AE7290|nr:uncharacterized protein LOC131158625 [Malania oleifera]
MTPYEALYGCWFSSSLYWDEVGEQQILGSELIQKTFAKVELIRERIRVAQSRQKCYVDTCGWELEFEVGDMIFLKIAPMKRCMSDPLHVLSYEPLEIGDALAYEEVPVQILDQKVQKLCTKDIPLVKYCGVTTPWRRHHGS